MLFTYIYICPVFWGLKILMVTHLFFGCFLRGAYKKPSKVATASSKKSKIDVEKKDSDDEVSLTAGQERKRKLDHDKETHDNSPKVQRIFA